MTLDSFEKYASDFFALYGSGTLRNVHPDDAAQVKVAFSIQVSHLDNPDNFRIYPIREREAFYAQAARGCCGEWNSQVRCSSGRTYWVGCNYGH